jgi:hypothetical protein
VLHLLVAQVIREAQHQCCTLRLRQAIERTVHLPFAFTRQQLVYIVRGRWRRSGLLLTAATCVLHPQLVAADVARQRHEPRSEPPISSVA